MTKGCRIGSKASTPPNIPSICPNEESLITSTNESNVGAKSTFLIIGAKSTCTGCLLSVKKRCMFSLLKNCAITSVRIPLLKSSKRSGITPEPYNPGTFSNNICTAIQLVNAPDIANSPTVLMMTLSNIKPSKTMARANPLVIMLLFKEMTPRRLN